MSRIAEWSPYTTYIIGDVVNYIGIRYTASAVNRDVPPLPATPIWVGVPPSTGVNVIASSTNATMYPTFVSALSGTLPVLVDSDFTYNPALGDLSVNQTLKLQSTTSGGRVAVGYLAGETSQSQSAVAIGDLAGQTTQGLNAVSVGALAGNATQGDYSVAIGNASASTNQGTNAVAVGVGAGNSGQGAGSVAMGDRAGQSSQGLNAVAIGALAGETTQGVNSIAIGISAGKTTQSGGSVAIGALSAETAQGTNSVAIGINAGNANQGQNAVSVGVNSGLTSQGNGSVAIGINAGRTSQQSGVAVGNNAGVSNQGLYATAVGRQAGTTTQGANAVAIGSSAGNANQGLNAVSIGVNSGNASQGDSSVAIGVNSGLTSQGANSVAIGNTAGQTSQGFLAIAIGQQAGQTNQHANSIILNASGSALNSDGTSRFFVNPIRSSGNEQFLMYNPTSKEITYGTNLTTNTLQITKANNTANGGGQIYLNGATGNRIDFNINGEAAPSFTPRSVGTKLVLYPVVSPSNTDFAIGIEPFHMWYSVSHYNSGYGFKWYGGTTQVARLDGVGNLNIIGALSKGSGSFKIDHPLPEKTQTHHLVHSFVEAPRADLYYRGRVDLVNGEAVVNIDASTGMTEGTFVALCRDIQCFTSNDTDWDAVKGKVNGNQLHIQCQNAQSTATVSWLVIGERKDKHMYDTEWTDSEGRVILEPLKTE